MPCRQIAIPDSVELCRPCPTHVQSNRAKRTLRLRPGEATSSAAVDGHLQQIGEKKQVELIGNTRFVNRLRLRQLRQCHADRRRRWRYAGSRTATRQGRTTDCPRQPRRGRQPTLCNARCQLLTRQFPALRIQSNRVSIQIAFGQRIEDALHPLGGLLRAHQDACLAPAGTGKLREHSHVLEALIQHQPAAPRLPGCTHQSLAVHCPVRLAHRTPASQTVQDTVSPKRLSPSSQSHEQKSCQNPISLHG